MSHVIMSHVIMSQVITSYVKTSYVMTSYVMMSSESSNNIKSLRVAKFSTALGGIHIFRNYVRCVGVCVGRGGRGGKAYLVTTIMPSRGLVDKH